MASSSSIPPSTLEAASADMRNIASDIGETLARSRELIQQAREAMARANLISDVQADQIDKGSPKGGTHDSPPS